MRQNTLRVLQIVPGTSVDGPGLRTSVYLAGCDHKCKGCHNPASWNFNGGDEMTPKELADIVLSHGFNVTLTGGDPLQHSSLEAVDEFVRIITDAGLKVWCYTGYSYDEIAGQVDLIELLKKFDAIVEGPFLEDRLSPDLPFRGSDNQHIVKPDGTIVTEYDNVFGL